MCCTGQALSVDSVATLSATNIVAPPIAPVTTVAPVVPAVMPVAIVAPAVIKDSTLSCKEKRARSRVTRS